MIIIEIFEQKEPLLKGGQPTNRFITEVTISVLLPIGSAILLPDEKMGNDIVYVVAGYTYIHSSRSLRMSVQDTRARVDNSNKAQMKLR